MSYPELSKYAAMVSAGRQLEGRAFCSLLWSMNLAELMGYIRMPGWYQLQEASLVYAAMYYNWCIILSHFTFVEWLSRR